LKEITLTGRQALLAVSMVIITTVKGRSEKNYAGRVHVPREDNPLHLLVERVDAIVRRCGFNLHELFVGRCILHGLGVLQDFLWLNMNVEIDAVPLITTCGRVDCAGGMQELLRGISAGEITEADLKEPTPAIVA